MRRKIFMVWACFMLIMGAALPLERACADTLPVLVIGSDDYEPYNYVGANGTRQGVDVELATEALRRMGYTAQFRQIVWENKDDYLEKGIVDCLWGSFSMTGREDRYNWAGPYMYSRQVVIVQADSDIRTLADLNDKRISVQISTKPEELLLTHQVPGVEQVKNVYSLANVNDVFAALDKGYVDACAGHETAYRSFMGGRAGQYRVLDQELLRVSLGVAFYKEDDTGRAEALSDVLRELKEDGTTAGILERYGVDAQAALTE